MAYDPNEQYSEADGLGSGLRAYALTIQPKTFAAGAGTLAELTPVQFNTSTGFWEVWSADPDSTNSNAGQVRGFTWPDKTVLVSGAEVLGNVMLQGKIHYDDIVLPYNEDEADLIADLTANARALGLIIQGLPAVH